MRSSLVASQFQLLEQFAYFSETLYENYAIEAHHKVVCLYYHYKNM
jgi:hypothetical protein